MVILLNCIPILELYMAELVLKNRHYYDTYHDEIGLCAQVNQQKWEGLCDCFKRKRISTLTSMLLLLLHFNANFGT